uniref:Uncharacterized protein n=1 Tax=Alexandrium monilatum TaxID=311494 RepID=A0A7S4S4E6_9DINO
MAQVQCDIWRVVGGAAKGGIIVRTGKETTSPEAPGRLSTGSFVRASGHHAGRIHYELLDGTGPATGWVSLTFQGKDLLVKANEAELSAASANNGLVVQGGDILEVIGGSSKGGIVVRQSKDVSSPEVPSRLSTGALVRALEYEAGRVHYELLQGTGPAAGWVSTAFQGKDLLAKVDLTTLPGFAASQDSRRLPVPVQRDPTAEAVVPWSHHAPPIERVELRDADGDLLEFARLPAGRGVSERCNGELVVPQLRELLVDAKSGCCDDGEGSFLVPPDDRERAFAALEVLFRASGARLVLVNAGAESGACEEHSGHGFDALKGGLDSDCEDSDADAGAFSDGTTQAPGTSLADFESGDSDGFEEPEALDSEGEELLLCRHCHLPLGDVKFTCEDEDGLLHEECVSEYMLRSLRSEEDTRQRADRELKRRLRAEHGIGWKAERVPRNSGPARKLGCQRPVKHMCCLVLRDLEDGCRAVDVAATCDPAGCVNLEYLSIALKVRRSEGRDALFSLDVVDPASPYSPQAKRFEPRWLAGTSAGEVLFQADIYLKELSMGEYPQPIVGMRSCLEHADVESQDGGWSAREWFIVKKAEVRLSQDGVLMPFVELGVEAREQVLIPGSQEMEDAPVTRSDHPLVRYAEDFTRNLALIAERKSVIYHLRELAKATCLAKFLLDARVTLQDSWFSLAEKSGASASMELPQVWKTTVRGTIREDGEVDTCTHTVSGGVDLNMDRFSLLAPSPAAARLLATSGATRRRGTAGGARGSGRTGGRREGPGTGGSVRFCSNRSSRALARRLPAPAAAAVAAAEEGWDADGHPARVLYATPMRLSAALQSGRAARS